MQFLNENYEYTHDGNFTIESNSDYQIFVIWEKARFIEEKIVNDINENFNVLVDVDVIWSKKYMGDNFHRFYHIPPNGKPSTKSQITGEGPFRLIIIEDNNPVFNYRKDASGRLKLVNVNVVDRKVEYRKWTGGSYLIHCTDTPLEFRQTIFLLYNREEIEHILFLKEDLYKFKCLGDLNGSDTWSSVKALFDVLNYGVKYVVLRNREDIEKTITECSGDVDLLCDDMNKFISLTNAKKIEGYDNFFHINIMGKNVLFDVRYCGDDYYDRNWQEDILVRRVIENGIYVPRIDDYFFSHLYHSFVHKRFSERKYAKRLVLLAKKINIRLSYEDLKDPDIVADLLRGYLLGSNYQISVPCDKKVFINISFLSKVYNIKTYKLFFRYILQKFINSPRVYKNFLKEKLKKVELVYIFVQKSRGIKKLLIK